MIDMNDHDLQFEHMLRKHTNAARDILVPFLVSHGVVEYSAQNVTIEYDAADGGTWRVYCYHSSRSTDMRGAELFKVVEAFKSAFAAQHELKQLRTLLPSPVSMQQDAPSNEVF